RAWEIDPPKWVKEPLEWILLTNEPTVTLADALKRLEWYESRWIIEEFHKAQKTGCGIEQMQFRHVERLEPMIALLSVVAVMLVNLRTAARQEDAAQTSATRYVPRQYVHVLSVWRYRERRPNLTIQEFTLALGRLGGHQNRKGDGPPGWQTLAWLERTSIDGRVCPQCRHRKKRLKLRAHAPRSPAQFYVRTHNERPPLVPFSSLWFRPLVSPDTRPRDFDIALVRHFIFVVAGLGFLQEAKLSTQWRSVCLAGDAAIRPIGLHLPRFDIAPQQRRQNALQHPPLEGPLDQPG